MVLFERNGRGNALRGVGDEAEQLVVNHFFKAESMRELVASKRKRVADRSTERPCTEDEERPVKRRTSHGESELQHDESQHAREQPESDNKNMQEEQHRTRLTTMFAIVGCACETHVSALFAATDLMSGPNSSRICGYLANTLRRRATLSSSAETQ